MRRLLGLGRLVLLRLRLSRGIWPRLRSGSQRVDIGAFEKALALELTHQLALRAVIKTSDGLRGRWRDLAALDRIAQHWRHRSRSQPGPDALCCESRERRDIELVLTDVPQ